MVIGAVVLSFAAVATAIAATPRPAIKTFTPHSENDITNLDVLRQQIRNYYGDPLGTGTVGNNSFYAKEARSVAAEGRQWLRDHFHARTNNSKLEAIVLDVDDTSLVTWNYELFSKWAFDPVSNGQFVTDQRFPAVPGMVALANQARREGYAVIFLTGRPAIQEDATLGNLTADGIGEDAHYPDPATLKNGEDGLFTKPVPDDYPHYLVVACAGDPNGTCTTDHYKVATRAHIEALGYEIVANFGDQFGDLAGGHADRTFKLPNPNYFIP
jgi:predicted secreted acid phosphatase